MMCQGHRTNSHTLVIMYGGKDKGSVTDNLVTLSLVSRHNDAKLTKIERVTSFD